MASMKGTFEGPVFSQLSKGADQVRLFNLYRIKEGIDVFFSEQDSAANLEKGESTFLHQPE